MADLTTIGFKAETSGLTKAQQELTKTAAAGQKVDKSLEGAERQLKSTSKAAKQASSATGGLSRKMGMAGVQVEQFVGQVQGGGNALRALSYQATDLGLVLGAPLAGVVVGLGAALVSALVPALGATSNEIDELIDSIKELREESALTKEQAAVLNLAEKERIKTASMTIASNEQERASLEKKIKAYDAAVAQLDKDIAKGKEAGRTNSDLIMLRGREIHQIEVEVGKRSELVESLDKTVAKQQVAAKVIEKSSAQMELNNSLIGKSKSEIDKKNEADQKLIEITQRVSSSLEAQVIALRDGAEASLEYNVAQTLGLKAGEEIPANIQTQIDMITLLTKKKKEASEADKLIAEMRKEELINERELDALISKVDDFGGAWTRTGNAMVDAFGETVDVLADYEKRMSSIADLQDDLNEKRKDYADGTEGAIKIDSALAELNEESLKAQVGGYAQLAGAVGDYFDEKTAASRAALALEQTLTAIELVLTAKKTAAKVSEGAAAMFAALGPFGFAAVAGMVAVMASFGFSGGSGGSSGSAGTVFGSDDPSESAIKSNERLEDIQLDQLAELRGIKDALGVVSTETSALAALAIRVDAPGLNLYQLGRETDDRIKEDWRNPEILQGLLEITSSIKDASTAALDSLGFDMSSAIEDYQVESSGTLKFEGKTGEEIEEMLSQAISTFSDTMIEELAPEITKFQQIGEGMLETLVRVAQEQAVFNDSLELMGMSLSEVSSIIQIEVAQSIIELTGGLENFSDLIGEFFSEFLTEEEQFAHTTKSLTEAFSTLGLSMFESRDGFKDYITGLDLTDDAQQRLYAGLLELVPALDEYYDTIEDRQQEALDAELELIEEAKNARLTALYTEQSMLQSVVSKFLPSAQSTAITAEAALAAARSGDFTLANSLTPTAVSSSNYGSSTEFALAQARQAAVLAEIGQLAELELTDTEYEISLLETQNDILEEINANIINQALIGGESNQATQTASVAQSSEQMAATQEEVKYMTESMTRNISEMRNDINQIKNDGLSVYTRGSDVVATTSV